MEKKKRKSHPKDLTGMRFGKLTVLHLDEEKTNKYKYWVCKCNCGKIKSIPHYGLTRGQTKSCGCIAYAIMHNRKTHAEYEEEVARCNPNIEVLGEYTYGHNKIKVKCKICNHIWDVEASSIIGKKSTGCLKCFQKYTNKKDESVIKESLSNLLDGDFELVDEYMGNKSDSLFLHKKCGNTFYAAYDVLIKYKNSLCPCCRPDDYQNDNFLKNVKQLYGDDFSILDTCYNSTTRLRVKHNVCEYVFETEARHVLSGRLGCCKCSGNLKWDTERYKQEVYALVGNEYAVCSEYIDSQSKIKIRHENCGREFWVKSNSFIRHGGGCRFCHYDSIRKTSEQFISQFNERDDSDNYEFLSDYVDYKTKMKILSKNCGHIFYMSPNRLLSNKATCPICYKSKGEDRILSYLEDNNILYHKEKAYPDLIGLGGGNLRYDYLVFYNEKSILIEYQGEQHERYIKGLHKNKYAFIKQQKHDQMKIEYAQKINVPLLHIWYYDFDNIEEILDRELNGLISVA